MAKLANHDAPATDRSVSRPGTRGWDVWILDWARNVEQRFTFGDLPSPAPLDIAWSPTGDRLAYVSYKTLDRPEIVIKGVTGAGSQPESTAVAGTGRKALEDWSKDGRYLIYMFGEITPTATANQDIWALPLFGDGKPFPVVQSPFRKNEAHLSWDGRWLAYNTNDSGTTQVWVVSFPAGDQKRQISTTGGSQAHWRQDGKELYYLAADGKMMAVDMTLGPKLDSGTPRVLFDTGLRPDVVQDQYRVTPDGKRFLLLKPVEGNVPSATPIEIVLNWTAALPK